MTLEQLEQQRAVVVDDDQLPATATRADLAAHQAKRFTLDARIGMAKEAATELATLDEAADAAWLDRLTTWRKALCDELLTIKSPIRDSKTMGVSQNLTLSIRCVDFGIGQLRESGRELTNLRLGELMIASGVEVVGADPSRNNVGRLPWHGSVKETEARLKETAKRRARAQQRLDSALIDDDERDRQEAVARTFRDALNRLDLRGPNLDVWGRDEASLTAIEKEAVAWFRRASRGEPTTV